MKKEIPNFYPDQNCFFCGRENAAGLGLEFFFDDETQEMSTEYVASAPFTGLGNILHGGIQSGLFDEIMGWTAHYLTGEMGVTSELNVRFLKPAYLGTRLVVSCRLAGRDRARIRLEAKIETSDGILCSEASGIYYLLPEERFGELTRGRDK
ncbi:MAG: Thioesterase superfamily protein [Syntrophorhabdaceae bacterium PtaU1.Bin034]|jgi:uncharacterized protein (TIGR00369 family)|nr:MAG: Thioesterase superfamily protein [Syntrophorhabdaceae bacterium PtaU1.Bin034]